MNKRAIFISIILLLIVLFLSVQIYSVNYGTCLDVAIGSCDYVDIDLNEVDCAPESEGYYWHEGNQIGDVPDCVEGCCCGAVAKGAPEGYVYMLRGECVLLYDSTLYL